MPPSRWESIAAETRARIESGELRPGDRLPSEAELAARWQVCRMTVHRAMQELQRQGHVTRRRGAGTVVAAPPARAAERIALLFFNSHDYPQTEYIHGIRAALPDECHVLLCDTRDDPRREAQYLRRMQKEADGILCFPTCAPENTPLMRRAIEAGVPLVCVDRVPDGLSADAVITDNYGAARAALRDVAARGRGRIAHFTEKNLKVSAVRERMEAWRDTVCEAGVEDPETLLRVFPKGLGEDFDQMIQAAHDALFTLLHQPEPPQAVFCLEDYYMAAVLEACERMGITVPADLEIVSFSDCPTVLFRSARHVHRIAQRPYEMGRLAAERLQRRILGGPLPREVSRVGADLVPAASCPLNVAVVRDTERTRPAAK